MKNNGNNKKRIEKSLSEKPFKTMTSFDKTMPLFDKSASMIWFLESF